MSGVSEQGVVNRFKDKSFFTREELYSFYKTFDPDLKETTFRWRIYELKKREIIKSLKRGVFVISGKTSYQPTVSSTLIQIIDKTSRSLDEIDYCIWETSWLNEFAQHQTSRSTIIIEIEKELEQTLFYELKDSIKNEVFLNPDEKTIDLYVSESKQPVVIKKLLTRAPVSKRTEQKVNYATPRLEKILVDIFTEKRLFYYLQGTELIHIYENAISTYAVNFTTLFSYAKRRERDQDIKQFITTHMPHLVKNILE